MLGDIRNPKWMYIKAVLLLIVGFLAGGILILQSPRWETVALLAIAIWGFSRAYYFAFYVIEHYVDPKFRFAGLIGVARYVIGWKKTAHAREGASDV
jgi:hypothetical protein